MATTYFNPAQQILLRLFDRHRDEAFAQEIKEVLEDYFRKKREAEAAKQKAPES